MTSDQKYRVQTNGGRLPAAGSGRAANYTCRLPDRGMPELGGRTRALKWATATSLIFPNLSGIIAM
jgi:hypothetical protein